MKLTGRRQRRWKRKEDEIASSGSGWKIWESLLALVMVRGARKDLSKPRWLVT